MFRLALESTTPLSSIKTGACKVKKYDIELDDGRSVIADICEVFADSKKIRFVVSGFGRTTWPVDCRFDLPIIIEQLPEIRKKNGNDDFNFSLDFYEQGIEREIIFVKDNDNVILKCISRSSYIPEPNEIVMKKEDVRKIINKLHDDFMLFSSSICNDFAMNNLLIEWMNI